MSGRKGGEQNDKLHDKFRHTMVINSELITFRGSHPGLPSWPGLGGARWFLGCNEVLDFGVEFFLASKIQGGMSRDHQYLPIFPLLNTLST